MARVKSSLVPPDHLADDVSCAWRDLVASFGDDAAALVGPDLEALATQVARMRAASARVAKDGVIIRTPDNKPVPHPALDVERQAQAQVRQWSVVFDKRRGDLAGRSKSVDDLGQSSSVGRDADGRLAGFGRLRSVS